MSEIILPSTLVGLVVAFEPSFTAPSYRTFSLLVAGWIHCEGRRTITAVAVASGGVDPCHISVFQRFIDRATWSLDALGQVVFRLDDPSLVPRQFLPVLPRHALRRPPRFLAGPLFGPAVTCTVAHNPTTPSDHTGHAAA